MCEVSIWFCGLGLWGKEEEEGSVNAAPSPLPVAVNVSQSGVDDSIQSFTSMTIDGLSGVSNVPHLPPSVDADFSAVQWTYLDPMGNVQGFYL